MGGGEKYLERVFKEIESETVQLFDNAIDIANYFNNHYTNLGRNQTGENSFSHGTPEADDELHSIFHEPTNEKEVSSLIDTKKREGTWNGNSEGRKSKRNQNDNIQAICSVIQQMY